MGERKFFRHSLAGCVGKGTANEQYLSPVDPQHLLAPILDWCRVVPVGIPLAGEDQLVLLNALPLPLGAEGLSGLGTGQGVGPGSVLFSPFEGGE